MRRSVIVATALLFMADASSSFAAAPCRDAKGKFAKCGTPGAKPV